MRSNVEQKIFFFDSNSNLRDLKKILTLKDKVITFDYESHEKLLEEKIDHEVSDNYLDSESLNIIQTTAYKACSWYDEISIKEEVHYKGINLGELFYAEFYSWLFSNLKKFLEINKIYAKYNASTFVTSTPLSLIIKNFTNNVEVFHSKFLDKSLNDAVEIPIKINNFNFALKISHKTLFRLQKIPQYFMNFFLKTKLISYDNKKTVLLVNCTTMRFKNFLKAAPKYSLNIIKYDRLVPAIWNLETLSIIKNSNCFIENLSTLQTDEVSDNIKKEEKLINKKIEVLSNCDDFFNSFFSINEISFWNVIKEQFLNLCKKRFIESVREITIMEKLFQKYNFNKIVILNEVNSSDLISINFAKKMGIRIVYFQHGFYYDSPEMLDYYKFIRSYPFYSDDFIVWGKSLAKSSINYGVPKNKIHDLGATYFDHLFKQISVINNTTENYILLATDAKAFNRPHDLTVNNIENYYDTILKVCQICKKLNKKLIIKCHPSKFFNEDKITKSVDEKIKVIKVGDIVPLIKSCEILITTDLTTSVLEGQILQKPVISLKIREHYGKPSILLSDSCIQSTIKDLEKNLEHIIKDVDYKKEVIHKGNSFLNDYFTNQCNASEAFLQFLVD